MLETPKALDTIIYILLVKILKDITMDNQQETNDIILLNYYYILIKYKHNITKLILI
jgi:hypothetical protein